MPKGGLDFIPKKKYSVGIIPHFKEQDHPVVKKLLDNYDNSTLIDLKENPKKGCRKNR